MNILKNFDMPPITLNNLTQEQINIDEYLKQMIGKKVEKIFASQDKLTFQTDGGVFRFEVYGDCCSTSVFYDFYGVENLLNNGAILDIKEVDLLKSDLEDMNKIIHGSRLDDYIQKYGYQFTTESPEFGEMTSVFSFRNYSNGYYGGNLIIGDYTEDPPELKKSTSFIE
jgi:hypothetical protein